MTAEPFRPATFHEGFSVLTVQFDFEKLADLPARVQLEMVAGRRRCLRQMGAQILEFSAADYAAKSTGGTGSDGISWSHDARATVRVEVYESAAGQRIVLARRALAAQIKTAQQSARTGGKEARKWARQQILRLRTMRRKLLAKLNDLIDVAWTSKTTGVESGEQQQAARPGFRDSDGGNVLRVRDDKVTVGYGRTYSWMFDARRDLLPKDLPQAWVKPLETIAERWGGAILKKEVAKI